MADIDLSGLERVDVDDENVEDDFYQEPEPEMDMMPETGPAAEPDSMYGADRRAKINELKMLVKELPHKLKEYEKIKFDTLGDAELEAVYEEMYYVVESQTNVQLGVKAFCQSVVMVEHLAVNFTPLKLQGLSNTIDQDLIDDVKIVLIKNSRLIHVKPEARIAMRLATSALLLHAQNSAMEEVKAQNQTLSAEPEKPEIPPEKKIKLNKLNQKFGDL